YSRILLYQYSPRSERNISVHYNTNLEPGTSCVFSGCVRTGPAENNVYKYNIQEATCNQSIDNWRSSSSMTIDSTSMISPSPSPLPSSTSTDSTPSSSLSLIYGISESNFMINIPTKTVSNNGGSLTAGIGISNILLPTCSLDSSMLARSMLVVCVILAVAIIVFGAIIIIFAFALCHIRSRQIVTISNTLDMAIRSSLASLAFPLLFTALLHLSTVARAQEYPDGVCRPHLVKGDKSDSSLVGPYHNFSVSCINDSFALLNVRETGKRDYMFVTVEMKCTNEILNTS
uniref:Uncharacterized protein n=1 Tax=Amphimedon queenslandica TaxID=400682 RepID=A0A1X7VPW3_AMPQE